MTRDHDPMALLAAEPTGPAAAPLRDRIALAVAAYYRDQHGVRDIGAARDVAGVAIRMVAEAAVASTTAPPLEISQVDALRLLYARLTGEDGPLGRAASAILRFHYVLPGPGTAEPGCSFCAGAGEAKVDDLGPQHCHCRCDCCACGDPLCLGPCDMLGVLLDVLVPFGGVPAGAIDVPRLLAELHRAAIARVLDAAAGEYRPTILTEDPAPGAPIVVSLPTGLAAEAATAGLRRRGFRVERVGEPSLVDAVHGVRINVTPPPD
jgi:hypothetical protein